MKRLIIICLLAFLAIDGFSQTWSNTNIKLTNPAGYPYGINIDNDFSVSYAREFSFSRLGSGKLFSFGVYGGNGGIMNYGYIGGNTTANTTHSSPWMVFMPDGKVGIGTTSPDEKLTVQGDIFAGTDNSTSYYEVGVKRTVSSNSYQTKVIVVGGSGDGAIYSSNKTSGISSALYIKPDLGEFRFYNSNYADNVRIRVNGNSYFNGGNIGIGTTTPDYKLDVLGTIRANEVKVATGWSDFVFEPDYNLKSLDQVEEFINQNGHLPDIPSTKEVQENGISLGEMDAKLLQKIEELTLYMIELKKENMELKKLKVRVKELEILVSK